MGQARTSVTERLSLIAGSGALVPQVVEAAEAKGYTLQLLSLEGRRRLLGRNSVPLDLASPEQGLAAMREFGATLAAMAGGVRLTDSNRERLLRLLDAGGESVGDTIMSALAPKLISLTGARVVGVHEIAPELLAGEGGIAGPHLSPELMDTATFAIGLARKAGDIDLGQAVVVSGRRAVAVEDIAGTDALLRRVRTYRRHGLAADSRSPLVLAKAAKPAQPHFVDLPAIGPRTIANARRAGITVIAIQAGATILIEREKLIAAADASRITIIGIVAADA